jgi:aromatic ring-opening dioxygenase LigB subunit
MFINWSIVKGEQSAVRLPFCAMITTDDLSLKDIVHFTTASYQIIGRRFGESYLGLVKW